MDDIIAQINELRGQLQNETNLRLAAEGRLASLENNTQTNAMQTSTETKTVPVDPTAGMHPLSSHRVPKVAVPDKFDGTRGMKAEVFASQVSLYVLTNAALFPTDVSKVAFALSYLSGEANLWGQPLLKRILDETTAGSVTFSEFSTGFRATFFDTDRKARAEKEIRTLTQTKTAAAYVMRFNLLAPITGWELSTLISHFRQGLTKEIRLQMIQQTFTKLEEITDLAVRIDNKINGIRHNDSLLNHTASSTNRMSIDPDAMDISAFSISREEYDRRRLNGLCYNCGLGKHLASECRQPKAPGNNGANRTNRPNSKTRISELEARLAELEARPTRATRTARISELETKIAALEAEDKDEEEDEEEPLNGTARE